MNDKIEELEEWLGSFELNDYGINIEAYPHILCDICGKGIARRISILKRYDGMASACCFDCDKQFYDETNCTMKGYKRPYKNSFMLPNSNFMTNEIEKQANERADSIRKDFYELYEIMQQLLEIEKR